MGRLLCKIGLHHMVEREPRMGWRNWKCSHCPRERWLFRDAY